MAQTITRDFVESFYRARLSRDRSRIEPFLDDNVDWLITGPIELLHFCGQRQGKAQVIDTIVRVMPTIMHVSKVEMGALLIDRDRAASFSRLTGVPRHHRQLRRRRADDRPPDRLNGHARVR